MRRFFEKDGFGKFTRTVLPFIVAFLVGLLLNKYPATWPFGEFVRPLRDALMIAGLLGTLIELWSVSVLVDHATDQLSERLVGYGLPRPAQELIHDLVHKTKRVYRDYRSVHQISQHPAKPDHVIARTTLSYKVVNNGMGAESYTPFLSEERMYDPRILSLEYAGTTYREQDLQRGVGANGVVTFSIDKDAGIVPSSAFAPSETLDADQCVIVRWDFTVEMPKQYSTVIAFAGVTVNPVIEVQASDGYEFFATMEECVHAPGGHTWEYKRAFIGGQHVRIWWKPIEA